MFYHNVIKQTNLQERRASLRMNTERPRDQLYPELLLPDETESL